MKKIAIVTGASSGIGKEFAKQIDSYGFDEIWGIALDQEGLDDLKKENSAVVDKLVSYVRYKLSRTELRICSKACRFFEKELYGKDVFYAYDGVVIKNLPYYANQLGITIKGDYSCYSDFHADMENIRTASGGKISRFELDQMIWYAHK